MKGQIIFSWVLTYLYNLARGIGIFLVNKLSQLKKWSRDSKTNKWVQWSYFCSGLFVKGDNLCKMFIKSFLDALYEHLVKSTKGAILQQFLKSKGYNSHNNQ